MVMTPKQSDTHPTARHAVTDRLDTLVPAAVRLSKLREQGTLSELEFEAGLSNLFHTARTVQAEPTTECYPVHLDWSRAPMAAECISPYDGYDDAYARVDSQLQPYFAYGWEYFGGCAYRAVHFEELTDCRESDTQVLIAGATVDLLR